MNDRACCRNVGSSTEPRPSARPMSLTFSSCSEVFVVNQLWAAATSFGPGELSRRSTFERLKSSVKDL